MIAVLGSGYWTCNVVVTEVDGSEVVPLAGRLYSAESPEFVSENDEILAVVDMVSEAEYKRGLWVIDRGADRKNLIMPMLKKRCRFLIRLIGNRHLLWAGREMLAAAYFAAVLLDTVSKQYSLACNGA